MLVFIRSFKYIYENNEITQKFLFKLMLLLDVQGNLLVGNEDKSVSNQLKLLESKPFDL